MGSCSQIGLGGDVSPFTASLGPEMRPAEGAALVALFDGQCRVCTRSAAWVAERDRGSRVERLDLRDPIASARFPAFDASQVIGLTSGARKRAAHRMEALGRWFNKRCPATKVVMHEGDPVSVILRTAATVSESLASVLSNSWASALVPFLSSAKAP